MNVGDIHAELSVRDGLSPTIRQAQQSVGRFSRDAGQSMTRAESRISRGFAAMKAAAGPFIALLAGGALVAGVGQMVELGASAAESASLMEITFGDAQASVAEWADELERSTGAVSRQAQVSVGELATFTQALGLQREEAIGLSQQLYEGAQDLASFRDVQGGTAAVVDKMTAALSGETEPLKSLGIVLSATAVEDEAFRLGLIKTKDELDGAAKATATASLIMGSLGDAAGDAARTMESPARQMQALRERTTELVTQLGTAFLPLVGSVATLLNDWAQRAHAVVQAMTPWIQGLLEGSVALGDIASEGSFADSILEALAATWDSLRTVLDIVMAVLTPLGGLLMEVGRVVLPYLQAGLDVAVAGLRAFTSGLRGAYNWLADFVPGLEPLPPLMTETAAESETAAVEVQSVAQELGTVAAAAPPATRAVSSAAASAKELAKEAKEAAAAAKVMMDRWGQAHEHMARQSELALKSSSFLAGIASAGNNAGLEWSTAFMRGPGGVAETLSPQMAWDLAAEFGTGAAPPFADSGLQSAMSFRDSFAGQLSATLGGTLQRALEGGGSWAGAFQSLGVQAGDAIGGKLMGSLQGILGGGALGNILNTALGTVLPVVGPVVGKIAGWIGGKIAGAFGPSEAELAARKSFDSIHSMAVETLGGVAEYQEHVSGLVADGWSRTLAETVGSFEFFAQSAGVAHEDAVALYDQLEEATKAGDEAQIARIQQIVAGWREAFLANTEAATESAAEMTDAAIETAKTQVDAAVVAGRQVTGAAIETMQESIRASRTATADVLRGHYQQAHAALQAGAVGVHAAGVEADALQGVGAKAAWTASQVAALEESFNRAAAAARKLSLDSAAAAAVPHPTASGGGGGGAGAAGGGGGGGGGVVNLDGRAVGRWLGPAVAAELEGAGVRVGG